MKAEQWKVKEDERENGAAPYFKSIHETADTDTPIYIIVPSGLGDTDATFIISVNIDNC